jgi:hypothetical protein
MALATTELLNKYRVFRCRQSQLQHGKHLRQILTPMDNAVPLQWVHFIKVQIA